MSMLDANFYPTPEPLITKMFGKVKDKSKINSILEPSAGKGDIINYLQERNRFDYRSPNISAIEKDDDLFATLLGKDIAVIERDFLTYSGSDIFDLIIMNPPFDNGDKHLLKAIDITYSGQIVCLLNAETLKNPCTRLRIELLEKLNELEADIEYLQGEFQSAERKTNVEVALIHINIENDIEEDLLKGATDTIQDEEIAINEAEENDLAIRNNIHNLELCYNQQKQIGLDVIKNFYSNYKKVSSYITLKVGGEESRENTRLNIQSQVNELNKNLRKTYWDKAVNLPEIREKLTAKNRDRFYSEIQKHSNLEFTANNVRSFVINLIGSYEQTLIDACVNLFDDLTSKYSYWADYDTNKLHFSTWKTNEAFKVAKKIIIPCNSGYSDPFYSYGGQYKLDWQVKAKLDDIDKVLNYIAGEQHYYSLSSAIENFMRKANVGEETFEIESTFFKKISFYKKGTLHLTFKDEDVLRKFNIIACKGKDWLPNDYGNKRYDDYEEKNQKLIESFEGKKAYNDNIANSPTFAKTSSIALIN
jgi:hypothetical protein